VFDLRRLRLLRELKHRGTLAAVAEALSYSPSTISQQLSLLESEAGVPLLEPIGRRVRLTPQAEILVAHTEALLERLEQAETDLAASLGEIRGTLRVASFQTAALALLPPALTLLRREHPQLRVELVQLEPEVSLPALVARDFDLVLVEEYPRHAPPRVPGLEHETVGRDPLRLALPGEAGRRRAVTSLRELPEQPWVMEPKGTPARQWLTGLCRDAGIEPDVQFESPDPLTHLRLVESGHAAAVLPDLLWSLRAPGIPLHPLPDTDASRRILTAVRRGTGQRPTLRAVRRAIDRAYKRTLPQKAG